jgi:hypothetical protein
MAESQNEMDIAQIVRSSPELAGGGRLLFKLLLDDSRSIRPNHQYVIDGYNECIPILGNAPGRVLIQTQFLNRKTVTGYVPPEKVIPITAEVYPLTSGTPLFVRTWEEMHEVQIEVQNRPEDTTMTFLFTDGWDTVSYKHGIDASDVKKLIVPLIESGKHIIGAFAVSDGHTDFRQVFSDMGIPPQWIKVLSDWKDVRAAMSSTGRSTSRASGSDDDFTTTSKVGF